MMRSKKKTAAVGVKEAKVRVIVLVQMALIPIVNRVILKTKVSQVQMLRGQTREKVHQHWIQKPKDQNPQGQNHHRAHQMNQKKVKKRRNSLNSRLRFLQL